jgi:hypothetical protein
MYDYEFRTDAARQRAASLSRDWPSSAPRRRVRLTLGHWLIGAGRRLAAEPRGASAFTHEALPRC